MFAFMYRIIFFVYFYGLFCLNGQNSIAEKKAKIDFVVEKLSDKKFLLNITTKSGVNAIKDLLVGLYPYSKFSINSDEKIIEYPLKLSINNAHKESDKNFPITDNKELTAKIKRSYSSYTIRSFVNIKTSDGEDIVGNIEKLSPTSVKISGKIEKIPLSFIPLPERLLFQGKKGFDEYINRLVAAQNIQEMEANSIYFKEVQSRLLKEYLQNNVKRGAFTFGDNRWGSIIDYISYALEEKRKEIIVDKVINKSLTKKIIETKVDVNLQEDNSVISLQEFLFKYDQNMRYIDAILVSRERINSQIKELERHEKIEEQLAAKKELREKREKQALFTSQSRNNISDDGVNKGSFIKHIISLIVGFFISVLLFLVLPKFSIIRRFLNRSSKSINLNSLDGKDK